jgi:hypothetical protein
MTVLARREVCPKYAHELSANGVKRLMRNSLSRKIVAISEAWRKFTKVIIDLGYLFNLHNELAVDGVQFLVDGLNLFLRGLQLLVGGLQLFVDRQYFFVGGLELFGREFVFIDSR